MTTTIDKFGRVLIPKQMRRQLGLKPGSTVELTPTVDHRSLELSPTKKVEHKIKFTDWGWPIATTNSDIKEDFDLSAFIRANREERTGGMDENS